MARPPLRRVKPWQQMWPTLTREFDELPADDREAIIRQLSDVPRKPNPRKGQLHVDN